MLVVTCLALDISLQAASSVPGSDGIALLRCCCAETVDRIVQEGFDMRLSRVAAHGKGTYFSGEGSAGVCF